MAIVPTMSWVGQVQERLLAWYERNQRRLPWRDSNDPYAIWVSEVMLQQTRVQTAEPYFHRFMSRFPDLVSLSQSRMQPILKLWEGLGYYRRARHLHAAARIVVAEHNARVPADPAVFQSLPGVGPYICAAVMSIAFDRPLAVVDGNVKRVLSRLMLLDAPVNRPAAHRYFQRMADRLLLADAPGTHNQAVMELGALVCRPRTPQCPACPLATLCSAHEQGRQLAYPVRDKRPRPR
jgi:A/G-specific adenine glycosylase